MIRRSLRGPLAAMSLAVTMLAALPASAQQSAIPETLAHQGRLLDAQGQAVTGQKSARFTLFDAATGGVPVWQEDVTLELADDGTFQVELGQVTALDAGLLTGAQLWLEMSVDDAALSPRLPLTSVPYAQRAASVTDKAIGLGQLADGVLDWGNIQNSPADNDTLGALMCGAIGEVAAWDGSAWVCGSLAAPVDESQVDAWVANNSYVVAMPCAIAGELLSWDGMGWVCKPEATDTTLTEAQVDTFVANNGFLSSPVGDGDLSDNISVDNGRLFAPSGAGNVGIGTTSTTAQLTVEGDIDLTRGSARTIAIPDGVGGRALTVKAGGYAATNGTAGRGGNLVLRGGNSNVSQGSFACPSRNSNGGDIELRAGWNVFAGACGQWRSGHVIFYGGDPSRFSNAEREIMRIHGDRGNVGIGTSDPSESFSLHIIGTAAATAFTPLSDARYKHEVVEIENARELVRKLRGVRFDWKTEAHPEMDFETGRQMGFIAQDLEPIVPEVVHVDEHGVRRVDYDKLTAVLVEALKEQDKAIAEGEKERAALASRLDRLERQQHSGTPWADVLAGGCVILLVGGSLRRLRP